MDILPLLQGKFFVMDVAQKTVTCSSIVLNVKSDYMCWQVFLIVAYLAKIIHVFITNSDIIYNQSK